MEPQVIEWLFWAIMVVYVIWRFRQIIGSALQ